MQSKAATVEQYLSELPPDRRATIEAVRRVILKNLDKDYQEGVQHGMIGYFVPHRVYPAGYHCDPSKPLCYAALAAQKNYSAVYLMSVYGSPGELEWFRAAWKKSGKRLDMGKSCIRFRSAEDLALDVIGEAIRRVPAREYIEATERALAGRGKPRAKKGAKSSAKRGTRAAGKKTAKKTGKRASKKAARGRA
jgi:hypothetical protein